MRRTAILLLFLLLPWPGRAAPEGPDADDQKLLAGLKVPTDGPGLLTHFRKRVPTADVRKKADDLVEKLSSGNFRQRERASADLVALGTPARLALARALKHSDAEVRRRAQECLNAIERTAGPEADAAAVRLLKARRPDGACAVLLDYLPAVRDAGVEEEVLAALAVLGVRGGKVDAALVRALTDKDAMRRAVAALVLGHSGTKAQRDKVHAVLRADAAPKVRLRAAQGLLAARDKSALPALLPLLTDAPPEVAQEVCDLLGAVAGDKAPTTALGEDAAGRKKCRADWDAWWKVNGAKLDLTRANVELPWLNPGQQARAVTMQFARALTRGDTKALLKTIDVPFSLVGAITLNTREDVERLLGQAIAQPQRPKVTFYPPRPGDLKEYLKSADVANQPAKDFLAKHPQAQLRLVYLSGKTKGTDRVETAAVLVRLHGGRAKVVGIGQAPPTQQRK